MAWPDGADCRRCPAPGPGRARPADRGHGHPSAAVRSAAVHGVTDSRTARRGRRGAAAAEFLRVRAQFTPCRVPGPVATLPGMSKHRQQPGPKGQSYVAAPQLPSYDRPPASDVTIVRRDGTQETRQALAPRLSRGSYDLTRPNSQETGKLARKCASCKEEFKEGQRKERRYDAWRHMPGECVPQTVQPARPVQPRPMGRKVPCTRRSSVGSGSAAAARSAGRRAARTAPIRTRLAARQSGESMVMTSGSSRS